jgi:hypothetical protein
MSSSPGIPSSATTAPAPGDPSDADLEAIFHDMDSLITRHSLSRDQMLELFAIYFVTNILTKFPQSDFPRAWISFCRKVYAILTEQSTHRRHERLLQ